MHVCITPVYFMYVYSALSFEVVMSCIQIIYNLNYHFEMLYNVFNIICNRIAVVKTILFMRDNLLEQFHTHSQNIHWHSYDRVTILWLIYIYDGAIWKSTVQIMFPMCNQVMFNFL